MSFQRSQLWQPASGITFSPATQQRPLYPVLDIRRFIHSHDAKPEGDEVPNVRSSAAFNLRPPSFASEDIPIPSSGKDSVSRQRGASEPLEEHNKPASAAPAAKKSTDTATTSSVEPPITSLKFKMSRKLFQAARANRPGTPGSYFSHTMYAANQPEEMPQKVKVHYCTSKHTMEHVCKKYFAEEDVLGFDMEWLAYAKRTSGPRDNVSLIQLASPGRIGLFHVARFPKDDFVAPTFQEIMESDKVRKVGVHIQADCTRLRNFLGIKSRGVFELSHLYKLVKHMEDGRPGLINRIPIALAAQVQDVLRLPLYKGQSVRSSDWTKPLSESQLIYSASDAYAGLQLFYVLDERRKGLDPQPELPHHAELGLPIPFPRVPTPEVSDSEAESGYTSSEDLDVEENRAPAQPQSTDAAAQKAARSPSQDARIEAANTKVTMRRASKVGRLSSSAAPSALRSYFIWTDNDDMDPASIAKLLRNPPLQTNTVICYILDSILIEKLPYPKARLKTEVLSQLHAKLASGKYQRIVQACADDSTQ